MAKSHPNRIKVIEGSSDGLSMTPLTPDLNNTIPYMVNFNDLGYFNDGLDEMFAACVQINNSNHTNSSCDMDDMFSFGLNLDSPEFNPLKQPVFAMIAIICYIIVIFLGAVGNCMVVLTVVKTRQMWNATNLFIANLALADIFVCIFDLPFSVYSQITGVWIFGATLCKLIPMMFGMVVYSSTLTLTMIAIDRYILVVHPLKTRMSLNIAMTLIVIIALVSAAVASPIAIYSKYEVFDMRDINVFKQWCYEKWPSTSHRQVYTILTLVLQHFIPLVIIGVLYTLIFIRIRKRINVSRASSRKTKTTKMLVAVVTVFTVTWTPYHIHSILSEFRVNPFGEYYKFADAMLRVFAMSSSCINPFLYGWLNDNYKTAFLSIIRKPTMTPKGIHREESDHTITKSNVINPTPSPTKALRKPLLPLVNNDVVKCKPPSNNTTVTFENVPLGKIKQNGVGNGNVYHSLVHVDGDGTTEVVLEKS